MLTASAMAGFKNHVKQVVAYAKYKIGSSYYKANITDIYMDSGGKVVIDFTIDPAQSGSVTVTEVQLFDTSGALWLTKTENITRKSDQNGIFYRFKIDIREI